MNIKNVKGILIQFGRQRNIVVFIKYNSFENYPKRERKKIIKLTFNRKY